MFRHPYRDLIGSFEHRIIMPSLEPSLVRLVSYLFNAKAFFMHVTQVEHGLGAVLLLRGQSVVDHCRLVIHIGPVTVEVIISQLNSGHCVTCTEE